MRRVSLVGSIFIAAVGITLGAGTPALAEDCSTACTVGGAGTGGESSDGAAGGFRIVAPSQGFPGSTYTNSGNENAGHLSLSGTVEGMAGGAFTPQGAVVGHYEGIIATFFGLDGTCNGICG